MDLEQTIKNCINFVDRGIISLNEDQLINYSWTLKENDMPDVAQIILAKGIDKGIKTPEMMYQYILTCYQNGDREEAIDNAVMAEFENLVNDDLALFIDGFLKNTHQYTKAKIHNDLYAPATPNPDKLKSPFYFNNFASCDSSLEGSRWIFLQFRLLPDDQQTIDIYHGFSTLFSENDEHELALALLSEAIKKNKANSETFELFAEIAMMVDNPERFYQHFEPAMRYQNSSSMVKYHLFKATNDVRFIDKLEEKSKTDYIASYCLSKIAVDYPGILKQNKHEYLFRAINVLESNNEFEKSLWLHKRATKAILKFRDTNYLHKDVIIKKQDKDCCDTNPFLIEEENQKNIASIVDGIILPTPIGQLETDSAYYYIMENEIGITFSERIKKFWNKFDYFPILETMATVHANMSLKNLKPYPIAKKLLTRATETNQNPDFVDNFDFIVTSLENSPYWVFNNDSTPENWMITKEKHLLLIDTEDRGKVPAALELANILDFNPGHFSGWVSLRREYINCYVNVYNDIIKKDYLGIGKKFKPQDLFLEYMNAAIYKSFTGFGYFSVRKRYKEAFFALDNGIYMIDHLRKNKHLIEQKNMQNLNRIRKSFSKDLQRLRYCR